MCATYLKAVPAGRRRWRDGPRWPWLCKYLGHQKKWWHYYIGAGDILGAEILHYMLLGSGKAYPSWHYNSTFCSGGQVCGRCGLVIGDFDAECK